MVVLDFIEDAHGERVYIMVKVDEHHVALVPPSEVLELLLFLGPLFTCQRLGLKLLQLLVRHADWWVGCRSLLSPGLGTGNLW